MAYWKNCATILCGILQSKQLAAVAKIEAAVGGNHGPSTEQPIFQSMRPAVGKLRFGEPNSGGDGGIRTLDTPLERITV